MFGEQLPLVDSHFNHSASVMALGRFFCLRPRLRLGTVFLRP
jgi:hypothetical protein